MITNDIETFYKNMEIHDKRKIARLEQENKQLKEQKKQAIEKITDDRYLPIERLMLIKAILGDKANE